MGASTAAAAAVPAAPSMPLPLPLRRFSSAAASVPINSLDFPHLRIDPAAPRTFGRDYEHGRDVRDAPVLVLHGLLGSAINWRTTAPKLTQRRRLLSLDVRNHGASPHTDDMRFSSCAADVIALMDAKGIKHAVLLGHSFTQPPPFALHRHSTHTSLNSQSLIKPCHPKQHERELERATQLQHRVSQLRLTRLRLHQSKGTAATIRQPSDSEKATSTRAMNRQRQPQPARQLEQCSRHLPSLLQLHRRPQRQPLPT
jgi:hypothetical protein